MVKSSSSLPLAANHARFSELVDDGYDENGYDRPSKSQVKREMHALLDLGKQLIELSPERLKQLPLAERLYEAIRMAQRTTGREAAGARFTSWAS